MGRRNQLRQNSRGNESQDRISRFAALCQHFPRFIVCHIGVIECARLFQKCFEAQDAGGIDEVMALAARAGQIGLEAAPKFFLKCDQCVFDFGNAEMTNQIFQLVAVEVRRARRHRLVYKLARSIGLPTWSFMPPLMKIWICCGRTLPVMARIGISLTGKPISRMARVAATPSMSGIWISIRTRSNFSLRSRLIASAPLPTGTAS